MMEFLVRKNSVLSMVNTIRNGFCQVFKDHGYIPDSTQKNAIEELALWADSFFRTKWFGKKSKSGLYFWGGVGRGKSFIMDVFYNIIPIENKRRIHFHAQLQELQRGMAALSGRSDPMRRYAQTIATQYKLYCIDEFHAHNIADAVLLMRFLELLVKEGVGIILTSNYAPNKLCSEPTYKLHFQAALIIIHACFRIINIDAQVDYRQLSRTNWGKYIWPSPSDNIIMEEFLSLTDNRIRDGVMDVNHHPLHFIAKEGDHLWVDFSELCESPRSSADFLWLTTLFARLVVSHVEPLENCSPDTRQRFLNLIDITYDNKTQLMLVCRSSPEDLCRIKFDDLERTISRLNQLEVTRIY